MTRVLYETATDPVYQEWAPHPALAERLVCTWRDPARERAQPVLPDACIDLVWDGRTLLVAGPDTRCAAIESRSTYVGVRFRPGAAPGFLRVSSEALLDARVELAALWGQHASDELAARLSESPEQAARVLECALLARLEAAGETDRLVTGIVHELAQPAEACEADGVRVRRVADSLGVSERTLRRRCGVALGYGPKTLERILRFRRALRLLRGPYALAEAARLAGYADQSHLSNEAQRLAGLTPGALAAAPKLAISGNGIN